MARTMGRKALSSNSPHTVNRIEGAGPGLGTDLAAKILNRPSEASVNGSLKALRRQVFYDGASTCATPSIAPDF